MGIFCLLGGPIANRIGLKYTLTLGAVGYPVYSYDYIFRLWYRSMGPSANEEIGRAYMLIIDMELFGLFFSGL